LVPSCVRIDVGIMEIDSFFDSIFLVIGGVACTLGMLWRERLALTFLRTRTQASTRLRARQDRQLLSISRICTWDPLSLAVPIP
jgi:hypothetical protein